jgi:pilus assembly protein CpaF
MPTATAGPPVGYDCGGGAEMELHERLAAIQPAGEVGFEDPFADIKNRLHLAIIGELGPQLYNLGGDPIFVRERVLNDVRERLAQESGLSRADRERLEIEIADDILGYGPVDELLADESVSEVMINGAFEICIEREGRLYQTPHRFNDESHLRRIIN